MYLQRGIALTHDRGKEIKAQSRPFEREWLYFDQHLNAMTYRLASLFRLDEPNPTIAFLGVASQNLLAVFATDRLFDSGLVKAGNSRTQGVTRYRYTKSGERVDNITDWALARFRETHADDLRRAFPRVPLHDDFARWRDWGETLLKLHIDYEQVAPWPLVRVDAPEKKLDARLFGRGNGRLGHPSPSPRA